MSLSSKPPGASRQTRQMQRSIMSSESRLVESAGQTSKALAPAPPEAWGSLCTAPYTPEAGRHMHGHPDLEPVLTLLLFQLEGHEVSQTVLSFCTNPRAKLTLSSHSLQLWPVLPPDVWSLVLLDRMKGAGVGPSPWMLDTQTSLCQRRSSKSFI